ncbi:serine/threonine-protein kinase [Streptomyces polygonati]|uniref:Serine/threonine-protein kinase n=1 Tax=Streptomyces polygonati TaxID=1617087 RepID=A0ABV8HYA6_9ACTN
MDELRADDPRWIGSYRLLGRLGTGGMGRVFLARSERGRTVAVKLVRPELAAQDEFRGRFRREVLAARRVGGRWTAPVLDADTEAEIPWVATGYVAGSSLQQVVGRQYGPLPERSVRVLASGLAHALEDIHRAGLVHRDLKPSNVMITIDGPRVIDFGIARALETVADGGLTSTGAMLGSPAFMSPEQVRGDRVTPACDIFCLGSVLAYAATGLEPFGAASSGVHAQMFRIVQEPPDLAAVPEGLRELVAACLVKEPEARPSLARIRELLGTDEPAPSSAGEPWLPGAIVAELGREVVRLLELEAAETGSLPVVPAEAVARAAQEAQEADPVTPPAAGPPVAPLFQVPRPEPESPSAAPARRGRGGALIAVLALLAVIAGGTTAYVAVREGGHDRPDAGNAKNPTPGGPKPTGPATTISAVSPAADALPSGMVGTWRTTLPGGTGTPGTRTLTIRPDGSAELLGEGDGYSCSWSMRVAAPGPPVELSPSKLTSGPPASCEPGEATTLTLLDSTHLRRSNVSGDRAPLTYQKM